MLSFAIKEKTFNFFVAGVFIFTVLGVALFNYSVNAYGAFEMKVIPGYNDARFIQNTRIYKTFLIRQRHADGLMLGSSRIEGGIQPLPAAWQSLEAYNMGMSGASLHEMLRNLQHANTITPLKQVLIGLDFFMFSAFKEPIGDFSENYFVVDKDGQPQSKLHVVRTYTNLLLSADALKKSRSTVKDSKKHSVSSHEENGVTAIPARVAAVHDNALLYRVFDSFGRNYFRKNGFWLNGPDATFVSVDGNGHSPYDDYRELLDYIYRNHIKTSFMIPPVHEYLLFGLDGIGLWPAYTHWKKEITIINEQMAAQYNQPPLPLWDFALVNDITREWLPEDPRLTTPKKGMHWFWDPAHATTTFGDEMQKRIFISGEEDIGKKLVSATVDQHLQQQTAALHQAQKEDAAVWETIKKKLQSLNVWQHIPAQDH